MDDDNPVIEGEALVTQEPASSEPEVELDLEAPEAEEEVEIERSGKKYRIPKSLEPELLMQSDYTRKTQTLAEERKAVEEMKVRATRDFEVQQEYIQDIAKLTAIQERVAAYEKLNWQDIEAKNPAEAQRLFREYTMLKNGRDDLDRDLSARQRQRQFEEQQETVKRIEQGRAELARRLPNLTPEKYAGLVEFGAKSFGFTKEELGSIQDPRAVETLYWAQIGKQAYEKQRASAGKTQQPDAQPVPTVGAKRAAPVTDLYRIKDPDQWAKQRNKELAARRRAG